MSYLKKSITREHERSGGGPVGFIARLVASALYVGYVPLAQGTFGSLWGPVLCVFIPGEYLPRLWLSIPVIFFIGVLAAGKSEYYWGRDAGRIVIDEVVGVLITLAFLPTTIPVLIVGFLLFRFFDIFKTPVAHAAERLPGGWGVMMDDVVAGLFGQVVLRLMVNYTGLGTF